MDSREEKRSAYQQWSGLILIIVVGILVAVYFFRVLNREEIDPGVSQVNIVVSEKASGGSEAVDDNIYLNPDYNFSLSYPADWNYKTSSSGQGDEYIFTVLFGSGAGSVNLNVVLDEMIGLVKNSISISNEAEEMINALPATRINGYSAKDGSAEIMVIFKNNGTDYVFRGVGHDFENIISTFEIK
ncbi:hypothetical protein KKF61_01065 [Patescibacteria group bacterium]|nr:hypothetical protein [Patescibacteria group bacterium]MBU0963787.1 hypothetical protein [Patescibacteria group bacterium]